MRLKWHYFIGLVIVGVFTGFYIVLLLNRYWQLEYFSVDNVYFHSALWQAAHGILPIINHPNLGRVPIFGDHFSPAIFLFSIPYIFTSRQEPIFILMALAYGLSAYLALLVGFKLIKSKFITYALIVAYFLYLGTQNAMIYGFHELNLMPVFFMAMVLCYFYRKKRLYWIFLGLLLLTKESMAAVVFGWGMFVLLSSRKNRSIGLVTMGIAVIYYFIITKFVIPHFSGRYLYGEHPIPGNIGEILSKLWLPAEKRETFIVSILSFAGWPVLSLAVLPLVFQDFLVRYLFSLPENIQYGLSYHYNLGLVPLLLFASIWSIHFWQDRIKISWIWPVVGGAIILIAGGIFRFYPQRGPLLMVFNPAFYRTTRDTHFLWNFINKVPPKGTIMTQNHLALVFAPRGVRMIEGFATKNYDNADYIVADLRKDQDPNDYFPTNERETRATLSALVRMGIYKTYYEKDSLLILKKQ